MSNNQFHKIIVYHYDHTKFTWGIDISEPNPEKAVVWVKDAIKNPLNGFAFWDNWQRLSLGVKMSFFDKNS